MGLNNASTITGYTVTSSDGQTCSTSDADALTCDVTGLTNGTAYTFTVRATNLLGASDTSSPSNSVTPGLEPAIPSAPVATAGNAQASVTWTKPDDGGFPIKSYTVISSGGEGCKTNDADTLTCVVTGLTNGTAYTFTVRAANELGASAASAPSNSVTPQVPDSDGDGVGDDKDAYPNDPTRSVDAGAGHVCTRIALVSWADKPSWPS